MTTSDFGWGVYLSTNRGLKQEYWFDNKKDALRVQNEYMDELGIKVTIKLTNKEYKDD
tara:strand:+ start:257 stop:430 length:174 start_codon:yes stop_codon:yes gene_type:complete